MTSQPIHMHDRIGQKNSYSLLRGSNILVQQLRPLDRNKTKRACRSSSTYDVSFATPRWTVQKHT